MTAPPAPPSPRPAVVANRRLGWGLPLGLLVVVAAAHAGALAPSRAFYSRDLYAFWHPGVEAFVRAVSEGAWPVWNPWFGFGEPMAANPNFQIAYPPTWLNLVLPAGLYFKLFVVAHSLAGAIGLALLALRLRSGRLGALAAGGAWAASGPLLSSIGMYHHFAGAAWTPWVVLALDRALSRPGAASAVVLGAAAGGQALAGSADLCFMTALLAAGWLIGALARGLPTAVPRGRAAATLVGSVVFAALLAAVQWLPTIAILPGTYRASPSADSSLYWSLHPVSLLDLLVPRLTAGAAATSAMGDVARARLFESREPLLVSIYLGVPAALGAAWALVTRRHRRTALVLAGGFAALVVAALGRHTPILPALLRLPGVAVFRFPPKYLLPAVVLWALLVGLGVDALARGPSRPRQAGLLAALLGAAAAGLIGLTLGAGLPASLARALADPLPAAGLSGHVKAQLLASAAALLLGALLFLLAARGWLSQRAAAVGLAVLALGDLVHQAQGVNPAAPASLMHYRPPVVDRLRADGDGLRIYSVRHPKEWVMQQFVRHPAGWPSSAGWVLGSLDRVAPAMGARWRLLGSYDGDLTGLAPPTMGWLTGRVSDLSASGRGVRFLQLAGVDYVVSLDGAVFGGTLQQVWEQPSVYSEPVRLLRTPEPLPKAFFVHEARVVADDGQALRMLEDPGYDARRAVIVPALPTPAPTPAGPAVPAGEVRLLWRRSDAERFATRSTAPGYLVVLEAFEAAWTAAVDGARAPVLRANLLFRAVPVPAGEHEVELRYRPRSLLWGALASAGAAAAGLVLFWGGRLR